MQGQEPDGQGSPVQSSRGQAQERAPRHLVPLGQVRQGFEFRRVREGHQGFRPAEELWHRSDEGVQSVVGQDEGQSFRVGETSRGRWIAGEPADDGAQRVEEHADAIEEPRSRGDRARTDETIASVGRRSLRPELVHPDTASPSHHPDATLAAATATAGQIVHHRRDSRVKE